MAAMRTKRVWWKRHVTHDFISFFIFFFSVMIIISGTGFRAAGAVRGSQLARQLIRVFLCQVGRTCEGLNRMIGRASTVCLGLGRRAAS